MSQLLEKKNEKRGKCGARIGYLMGNLREAEVTSVAARSCRRALGSGLGAGVMELRGSARHGLERVVCGSLVGKCT